MSGGRQPGVEGLSQRYYIGRAQAHGASLRSQMMRTEIDRKFDETCAEPDRSTVALAEACAE